MNAYNSLRRNSFWIFSGGLGGRVLEFVSGIVLARLLVPADFGLLVTIQIFTGVLGYFAAGGISEALVQAKSLTERAYDVVFTVQLAIGFLIYGLLFAFAPFLASWFNEDIYEHLLKITAITFLLRPFTIVPNAMLRRQTQFKPVAIIQVCAIAAAGITSIILALLDMGPWSLVLGGFLGTFTSIALSLRFSHWIPRLHFNRETVLKLGAYGIRESANELIVYLRAKTSNLVVSQQLGASQVGLFNKADSLSETPFLLISGSTYQTVFRALSSYQEDRDKSVYLFLHSLTLVSLYTLPFYVSSMWVAESLIVTLYGENWASVAVPFQILAIAGLFRLVENLSGAVIAARNKLGREIPVQLQTWGILIIGVFVGIQWGINGVAWGLLPHFFYSASRNYGIACSVLGLSWKDLWQALLPIIRLNAYLALAMFATDLALSTIADSLNHAVYLTVMLMTALIFYVGMVLFFPDDELKKESARWRTFLLDRIP